jgi:drug/metabolite transporter (DMT)-like permease
MFTLRPKLGVAGSSPILNVEPVAALAMAWLWLGQPASMVQVLGALLTLAIRRTARADGHQATFSPEPESCR